MTSISFITIGNELLKGRIANTNAAWVGEFLWRNGYRLRRVITIPDTEEAILESVAVEMHNHDLVLMCGGLGPTRDDITKRVLADYFGSRLVLHEPSLSALERRYASRGQGLNELNRRQAYVPEICQVLPNVQGTAPGMLFEREGKYLVSLPGVPFEMKHLLKHEVYPWLGTKFPPEMIRQEVIRLFDIPESAAAERMQSIESRLPPEVEIAYLPRFDGLWMELYVRLAPSEPSKGEALLADAREQIAACFADKLYAYGTRSLSEELYLILRDKHLTLAVAESLTGGQVAAAIVSVSGVSSVFRGSVTAYAAQIKTRVLGVPEELIAEHSVVSAPVAMQMAEGVRQLLGADIGISTTGLAETDGDRPPQAFIAYADRNGTLFEHRRGRGSREANIARTANAVLHLCLKKVQERFV